MLSQILVCVVMVALTTVSCHPEGPPLEACVDMFPTGHKVDAQKSTAIANIALRRADGSKATTYSANEMITVTLATANPSDTTIYYEGMFVQARRANCGSDKRTEPVGKFTHEPSNYLKTLDCGGITKSAICHKDHIHQTNQTFTWTAPATPVGHIYFQATVVKNTQTFWTGVTSEFLKDSNDQSAPKYCEYRKTNGADVKSPAMAVVVLGLSLALANVVHFS
ncbi:putative defense protein 3 [Gigantopelta aegis]|uniref:putative defense protein 3 n=1 Tax=Gigantopelta aegis TaxID=1735272 RepID=UPI001B88C230|nr:putative defense protein 3 [Gigantopelta aegis]